MTVRTTYGPVEIIDWVAATTIRTSHADPLPQGNKTERKSDVYTTKVTELWHHAMTNRIESMMSIVVKKREWRPRSQQEQTV